MLWKDKNNRKKITRPLRKRGGFSPRCSSNVERPKKDWIEIPVPVIVSPDVFAQAQERLEENKRYSQRRTKEPTLLQGMMACNKCGYSYYRTSTRTSKRKIYYYRCLGTDNNRYENGAKCKLEVNKDKSQVAKTDNTNFLGFTFKGAKIRSFSFHLFAHSIRSKE